MARGWIGLALLGLVAAASPAAAQNSGPIKRTPLQTFEVPGTKYQTVIGLAEIAPSVSIGRHTHPGVESGYLLEGEAVLIVEGEPDRLLKPGQSYVIGAGQPHDARSGPAGAKLIATYVVEAGKPLATPAP